MAVDEAAPSDGRPKFSASSGLALWLFLNATNLIFSSNQAGKIFTLGVSTDGHLKFQSSNWSRPTGLYRTATRLYAATRSHLWRFETCSDFSSTAPEQGRTFIPRNCHASGHVDYHEVGLDYQGRIMAVNTRYSCISTPDLIYSFRPVWKPSFISRIVPEDRCHLNGMAMRDGQLRYVTAFAQSDVVSGWRDSYNHSGVVIDVAGGDVIAGGLSQPHSPRIFYDGLWVLESGRGRLLKVDPLTGKIDDVAFCPGFLRGLESVGPYLIVTISKIRDSHAANFPLCNELSSRGSSSWCGVLVIDRRQGGIVEWLKLEEAEELFDVVAVPGLGGVTVLENDDYILDQHVTYDRSAEVEGLEEAKQSVQATDTLNTTSATRQNGRESAIGIGHLA